MLVLREVVVIALVLSSISILVKALILDGGLVNTAIVSHRNVSRLLVAAGLLLPEIYLLVRVRRLLGALLTVRGCLGRRLIVGLGECAILA